MLEKKVSVIIATYRREFELSRALESVAEQTHKNYEIVVVDDNDDDVWNRIAEEQISDFRMKYPKVELKYIQNHPNLGSAKTRNVGISVAIGDYVCFLDDDDVYLPNRISSQLSAMVEQSADYSITDLALYSEAGKLIEIRRRGYIDKYDTESLTKYHLMHHMTGTDVLMFKREYLESIGGFDPIDIGDEFYLMMKAIEHRGKFIYIPVCDVKAVVHTERIGLSSGMNKIHGENSLYRFKKNRFELLDKKTRRYIKMRHHMVLGFAYLRMKKITKCIREGLCAMLISPMNCMMLVLKRK